MKICKICGLEKERFVKNRHGNYSSRCRECESAKHETYIKAHPKKFMVACAKQRAKQSGVPFDLQETDFEIPECCPIFG